MLCSSVQEMLCPKGAQSLSLIILAGSFLCFCCSLATMREGFGFFGFFFCTFTTNDLFQTLHHSNRQCFQFSLLVSSYFDRYFVFVTANVENSGGTDK